MDVKVKLASLAAPSETEEVSLLVDTGATLSSIPREVLERLGLAPMSRLPFTLADGRQLERDITQVLLTVDGRKAPVPVAFGEPGEEAVLGATALEILGLVVDPVGKKLIPRNLLALMATTPQAQPPSPAIIFDTLNAYQRTAVLKAAIELDVFTAIGEGNATIAALARRCKTSEKGLRVLCDYLTVIGLLTKDGSAYGLTPDSATFLDRRSPACMGTIATFLNSPEMTDPFKDVAALVRQGGTILGGEGTVEPENPVWVKFARSMAPMMALPAEMIAKITGAASGGAWKVLDVAAGHGLFGIAIAKQNPQAAIVAVDWASVLEVARENARAAGVAGRYSTIPGSAFEVDFGNGYDLALLTNFLHHFDVPTCEAFLSKIHAALKPGGRAVTLEFVPNEDRVSPPVAAQFSLIMLGTTRAGDAYTFREFESMFRNAGFSRSELHQLPPTPQQLIISYA